MIAESVKLRKRKCSEKSGSEKPVSKKPGYEKPGSEKSESEKPRSEKSGSEISGSEKSESEKTGSENDCPKNVGNILALKKTVPTRKVLTKKKTEPFSCPNCPRMFSDKRGFEPHLKKCNLSTATGEI